MVDPKITFLGNRCAPFDYQTGQTIHEFYREEGRRNLEVASRFFGRFVIGRFELKNPFGRRLLSAEEIEEEYRVGMEDTGRSVPADFDIRGFLLDPWYVFGEEGNGSGFSWKKVIESDGTERYKLGNRWMDYED